MGLDAPIIGFRSEMGFDVGDQVGVDAGIEQNQAVRMFEEIEEIRNFALGAWGGRERIEQGVGETFEPAMESVEFSDHGDNLNACCWIVEPGASAVRPNDG